MNSGLTSIKNIIWALGIVIALFALLIGLVFSVSNKFYGEREDGTFNIGSSVSAGIGEDAEQLPGMGAVSGALNELPNTQDAGLEYLFNLTFLADGSLSALSDYSSSFGSASSLQFWTDSGDGLPAATVSSAMIFYPGDGSQITPVNAAMVYQPKRLVIYIGGDGLASATQDTFIAGYTALIQGIQGSSSTTSIICCSIASVSADYSGDDGLTAAMLSQANEWIRTVCTNTGVYYADLASVLNDADGYLSADYAGSDGRIINTAGINKIIEYFRMHGV